MNLEIGKTLTGSQLLKCENLKSFGNYEIYFLNEDVSFIFAIDNSNLICSCFEFHDREDGIQLAHMYTQAKLKGQGIGKAIITEAVNVWGEFLLPSTNNDDIYYFIENGLGFIYSCFKDGILTHPPFKRP